MLPTVEAPIEAVMREMSRRITAMRDTVRDIRRRRISEEFPTSSLSGREHDGRAKALKELEFSTAAAMAIDG